MSKWQLLAGWKAGLKGASGIPDPSGSEQTRLPQYPQRLLPAGPRLALTTRAPFYLETPRNELCALVHNRTLTWLTNSWGEVCGGPEAASENMVPPGGGRTLRRLEWGWGVGMSSLGKSGSQRPSTGAGTGQILPGSRTVQSGGGLERRSKPKYFFRKTKKETLSLQLSNAELHPDHIKRTLLAFKCDPISPS